MNKILTVISLAVIFSLTASVGIAVDLNLNAGSNQMNSEKKQVENEKNNALKGVGSVDMPNTNPDLPYMLQNGQGACLDMCQKTFDTCMSSGKSADDKYRCDDNRWRCTRSCDSKWYHHLQL